MEPIKLKTTTHAQNKQDSNLILQRFIEACEQMDVSSFEPLIDEDAIFQDTDKYRFLASWKGIIDNVRSKGISQLVAKEGQCQFCLRGHKTYEFHSQEGLQFAYIVETKRDLVKDIYVCQASSGLLVNN